MESQQEAPMKKAFLLISLCTTAAIAAQVGEKPGDQAAAAQRGTPPTAEAKAAFIKKCWRTTNCDAPPEARNPNPVGGTVRNEGASRK
ncbi:MAG TPA: hypothetical protein VFE82_07790 [Ramlibacter sp.]|uniref:hypothetical protein n=1 Tax=Ramlibacter sp. TaxID=1917967 RepID=UPI002D575974|nr:hypothetical protein [Ramlibacter sp.]HZY18367.1 hypothetical protein [Ramlibacter sp.]